MKRKYAQKIIVTMLFTLATQSMFVCSAETVANEVQLESAEYIGQVQTTAMNAADMSLLLQQFTNGSQIDKNSFKYNGVTITSDEMKVLLQNYVKGSLTTQEGLHYSAGTKLSVSDLNSLLDAYTKKTLIPSQGFDWLGSGLSSSLKPGSGNYYGNSYGFNFGYDYNQGMSSWWNNNSGNSESAETDKCAKGHNSDNGVVTIPATYGAPGVVTYTCKSCGKVIGTKNIPKLTVSTPKLSIVKNKKGQKLNVKWKETGNVTGYLVQYARNASFSDRSNVRVKGADNVSKILTGLEMGSVYYVRVRAYKQVNGKNYYSECSNVKAVEITK